VAVGEAQRKRNRPLLEDKRVGANLKIGGLFGGPRTRTRGKHL